MGCKHGIEGACTRCHEAERDRLRDALIACRSAVAMALSMQKRIGDKEGEKHTSAILETIDAAAAPKGN